MSHLLYLALLAACLGAVAVVDAVLRLGILRRPLRLARAVLPVFVVFMIWDAYAIHAHQWTYARRWTSGIVLPGGVPLEEALFFLVVPVCAIVTLSGVRTVRARAVELVPAEIEVHR